METTRTDVDGARRSAILAAERDAGVDDPARPATDRFRRRWQAGRALTQIHGLVAQVALVVAVLVTVYAVALAATKRAPTPSFFGAVVWAGLVTVAAALGGIAVAVTDHPPRDPLHILYGLLAITVLPGAVLLARDRVGTARSVAWAVAGMVLVLLLVRLFQTAG
jgi:hypothetical protein